MGTLVALDRFRQIRDENQRVHSPPPEPVIIGTDIWSRDYTRLENVVFGLLKAREIASFHLGEYDGELAHLLLNALEKAHNYEELGQAELVAAIGPIKRFILDSLNETNKKQMSLAIVILDLIEKSPARKG